MELYYFHKKSPTANHSQSCFVFCLFVFLFFCFFFGWQIKHKFVHQKLVCEFINTSSCHSEFTKENTTIQTSNVDSQQSLLLMKNYDISYYSKLFLRCELTK